MISNKSFITVLTEASVVGLGLIVLVYLVSYIKNYIPNITGYKDQIEFLFIVGVLFHLIFEYTGLNLWYAKEYCKLL